MIVIILIAVDTLSNTAESEKTNKLIDDPDLDVTYCITVLREYFSLENAINKPQCWSHAFVCQFCKRLLKKPRNGTIYMCQCGSPNVDVDQTV